MKRIIRNYQKNGILLQVLIILILTLAIYFAAYY